MKFRRLEFSNTMMSMAGVDIGTHEKMLSIAPESTGQKLRGCNETRQAKQE